MSLEIYAVFDTNDTPKKLKSSGSDEFYYYFPPPLPPFIVLFMVTKNPEDANYLFKISVCIDNELEDKDIGEMGGDRLSLCWNSDWSPEEIAHAETVAKLGRVLKLNILKEELPTQEEEYEEVAEEAEEAEEDDDITEEEKVFNEDELLKSSIAMLEDELDESEQAVQKLQETESRKNLLQEYIKGNMNGSHPENNVKTQKKTKKNNSTPKKATPQKPPTLNKDGSVRKPRKTAVEKTSEKLTKAAKKLKSPSKMESLLPDGDIASFDFEDETEKFGNNKVVAGRIGGKRASPFGAAPKYSKRSNQETDENKSKPVLSSPLCFSDFLPTRNPSRRWGHSFCPLHPGHAIVIGGEGEKKLTNADAVWVLDTASSTWKSQQTDKPDIGKRVGHTACYDENAKVVYLYGGLKHDKWFNDVYKLNTNTWKWTKIEAIGKAPTRAYHSCTMDYDELLIFGGVYPTPINNPDGSSSELCIFSTDSKSWYTPIVTGDIPSGRSGHSACMLDRKLYIFGGWDTTQCFNDIHVLDLGIMNFVRQSATGTVPSPRTWHASQLLSDKRRFCVYGGFNGARALDDLFIFSSVDNSWTKLFYPGLVCRAGHDVIRRNIENESGEKLLVFGGGDNDGHFYNDIATLNLG